MSGFDLFKTEAARRVEIGETATRNIDDSSPRLCPASLGLTNTQLPHAPNGQFE